MTLFTQSLLLFTAVACAVRAADALNNSLALLPPMGFNTWEWFRCDSDCVANPDGCISDKLYRQVADAMVANGMKDAGYEYVNVDDCWSLYERDPVTHRLVPDLARFPQGIAGLADYIHSKGLKFGLYGDVGTKTCANYPSSQDFEQIDADTFAEWGVDYIKMDGCNIPTTSLYDAFAKFGRALARTSRPMVYSCGAYYVLRESKTIDLGNLREHCNSWRNYEDVGRHIDPVSGKWFWDRPNWSSIRLVIDYFLRENSAMLPYHGPSGWNDADMMSIGVPQLDKPSYARTQFALWSILAAPLLVSSDLRTIAPESLKILLNRDIIAINQDPMGLMARVSYLYTKDQTGNLTVLVKPIKPVVRVERVDYYSYAIMVINLDNTATQKVNLPLTGFGNESFVNPRGYEMKELYTQKEYGVLRPEDALVFSVEPNDDCVIFRAIAQQ